jgi:hypothetical protein
VHHLECLKCGVCHNQPKSQGGHRAIRTPAGAVARCRSAFGTKSYIHVGRGPAAAGVGARASGQGHMSGPVRGHWLGKFVVGGVPLCYGINRTMRSAWWLVADCLRCALHVRHLLRSYLQPPPTPTIPALDPPPDRVGAATGPYYYTLVLPRHQPSHHSGASYAFTACGALQPPTWWSSYAATNPMVQASHWLPPLLEPALARQGRACAYVCVCIYRCLCNFQAEANLPFLYE